uniref:Uncharacterized protein n=1 Tax=Salix viminalis TaxID=40686 RepID=A0A6N2LTL1_SALVM
MGVAAKRLQQFERLGLNAAFLNGICEQLNRHCLWSRNQRTCPSFTFNVQATATTFIFNYT